MTGTSLTTLLLRVTMLMLGLGRSGAAQSVAGVLTVQERPGAEGADLRGAVVYLEPRGVVRTASDMPALRGGTIAMRGREFVPHVRIVLAGGSVAFPNEDPFSHNVFSNVDLGPFDLGLYPRRATRSAAFARPGVYPIYCNIHSKMVSFVVAVPSPWATQPDADGHFLMRDVPAGTYVLHAWHERGTVPVTREIVVPAAGISTLQLAIDARTYVAAPHYNKFGRPYAVIRDDRY
jgi:plastocyanin